LFLAFRSFSVFGDPLNLISRIWWWFQLPNMWFSDAILYNNSTWIRLWAGEWIFWVAE
jgi:hypothetical protein